MKRAVCNQCKNGEHYDEPARYKVRWLNPDNHNRPVTEWVCEDHYYTLVGDIGEDAVTVVAKS